MSRKAKVPLQLPKGVEVKVENGAVHVKGPKGNLTQDLLPCIALQIESDHLLVLLSEGNEEKKNFLGLYWSLIRNMIEGVTTGFNRSLDLVGVGFKANSQGEFLELQLGFSHPVKMPIPNGIQVKVEKGTNIQLSGADKQKVGQFAADIRAKRPPEPYKGKGVRYTNEFVRRKAGKAGKK